MLTKIESIIDVPDGFEFDRIDVKTKDGDYYANGRQASDHHISYPTPTILFRKKKPQTRLARMYSRAKGDDVVIGTISNVHSSIIHEAESHLLANELCFIEWVGDWQEYTV